jgi:hypothetical protein
MSNPSIVEVKKIVDFKLKNGKMSASACQTKIAEKAALLADGRVAAQSISELAQQLESLNHYIAVMNGVSIILGRYIEGHSDDALEFKVVVLGVLVDQLSRGCEDTWSGRGNELRRCGFEGTCRACGEVKELLV